MQPAAKNDNPEPPAAAQIAALRARLTVLEGFAPGPEPHDRAAVLSFADVPGLARLAHVLPWGGLPRRALHEVIADGPGLAAATGFCTALLGALSQKTAAPVLWIARDIDLYGPGLADFGLDPARLLLVRARRNREMLWAMEEGLRDPALAAVLAEVDELSLFASRRLQLAAEVSGVTGLILRRARAVAIPPPNAAVTRWRLQPAPGAAAQNIAVPRWSLELLRVRGGQPGCWIIEQTQEFSHDRSTDRLPRPALFCDRSAAPCAAAG